MKLAFIVQRYGKEILGGSETLARQLAERLARRHEITVLTTTAHDYITWRNEYPPGEDKLRGVNVHRFPVEGERNLKEFNEFSEEIYRTQASREKELEWLKRQGPVAPALVEYLENEHHRFDLLVFFTYLYYPTYYGLQVAPEKSVLVPTAHDEPPLRLGIFREMFQLPSSFLFNTEAEELLVLDRFPVHKKMRETIGMGMELLDQPDPMSFRKKYGIPGKYLLYAGRIDEGKGMEELLRYFSFYKEEQPASGNLQLILIGKLGMKLPEDGSIRYAGFVDEAEKLSAMAGATAVAQPSRMESLSIVTLEAFAVGTPVLVNAASSVLVEHCRKADAGFYYRDFEEFEELMNLLLSDRNLARSLGRNGQRYIKETYGWSRLLPKYELAFRASARPSRETRESRVRTQPQPQAKAAASPEAPAPAAASPEAPKPEPGRERARETELAREPEEPAPALERETAADAEPELEPEIEPPSEVAHLPSFYRSSVPVRTSPPAAAEPSPPSEEEAKVEPEPEPRPAPEPVEPAEPAEEDEPRANGELPEFFRPKPRDATREEAREEPEDEAGPERDE